MKLVQGQVATVAFSQKLEDRVFGYIVWKTFQTNSAYIRNLEMIYGNKKKLRPKIIFTSMSKFCFYIVKNSPCAKNIQLQLEIDTVEK